MGRTGSDIDTEGRKGGGIGKYGAKLAIHRGFPNDQFSNDQFSTPGTTVTAKEERN